MMKEQNRLLILWVIFGFIFIYALDGILYFLSNLIVILLIRMNLPFEIINYSYGTTVLILYVATAVIVLKKLRINSKTEGIYLTEFPLKTFIVFSILGAILIPLSEYLIGSVYQQTWNQYMEINDLERVDYLTFFGFKRGLNSLYNQAVYLSITIGFILLLKRNNRKTIANNGE